ncbi:4Fe-4S binding protein [Shewanella marina]|uniref:4Fe-4S binding protein n=1 Tax=Shewanella marina TaxID=487319 RepID=UPI000AD76E59|nr:4Fe-4S binding protein [Shewanella marina]
MQLNIPIQTSFMQVKHQPLNTNYQLPASLYQTIKPAAAPLPLWQRLWLERKITIIVISTYLVLLSLLFIFQHKLAQHYGQFLVPIRWASLLFSIGFIGYYAQGQLSVVNIYTLLLSLWQGFDINVFLLDPVIFILWSFVFVSLFLWGRGLFCGWLCPFGAIQELIGKFARQVNIKQWRISNQRHQQLQWLKYPLLMGLVATSFYSLTWAETLAEIEPFKTAITMNFNRYWPFTLYAILILGLSLFIHKFYCRYLCPLGAGLAILGKFRLFSWLKRRQECGNPCQLCHKKCQINAIKPSGKIDYDECIQCFDCLTIIEDKNICVVDKYARRKSNRIATQAS